ncbi:hypothetical protein M885DRAFT_540403 [Pelagophyceae sp. CCMP2097]|nr:hypothetical protein M885DRAFT_540403 [Pelagophyceae sp. CCMP2097]
MGEKAATRVPFAKSQALLLGLAVWGVAAGLYAAGPSTWGWFSYHPLSMMTAFVSFGSSAAIVKKRGGYENTKLHGYIMTCSVALAMFGWYVIYSNKQLFNKPHLTSWHSLVGVYALVGYLVLQVVGLLGLHPDFGVLKTNKTVRTVHKLFGRTVIAAGWMACSMGFNKMNPNVVHQLIFAVPLLGGAFFVLL